MPDPERLEYKKKYENKFHDTEEKGADLVAVGSFDPHDNQQDLRKRRDDTTTIGHFAHMDKG